MEVISFSGMRALISVLACAATLATTGVAHGALRERVGDLPNESAITALGDVAVVSVFEGDKYRLMLLSGDRLEPLPVPRSRSAFDADLGPGKQGRPTVVYSLRNHGIYRLRIGAAAPTRIATGEDPTIWRETIAYSRPAGTRDEITIRTGNRTRRLLARGYVEQLELRGSMLAVDASQDESLEIELVSLRSRSRRLIARTTMGVSGLDYVGLSFTSDHLGWHRSCYGDSAGCRTSGTQRYNLKTGAYEALTGPYRSLSGFALTRDGLLEINGGLELGEQSEGGTTDCAPRCPINRVTDLSWKRTKAPIH